MDLALSHLFTLTRRLRASLSGQIFPFPHSGFFFFSKAEGLPRVFFLFVPRAEAATVFRLIGWCCYLG